MRRKVSAFLILLVAGWLPGPSCSTADTQDDALVVAKFFELYEAGDYTAAIAAAPARFRESSLYAKDSENLPPYKRDEPIYFDILAKASGEKPLPPQDAFDKEIYYYLGVMHFRMNNWEQARRRLLQCLQLDPGYRMAHVYLFRVYSKIEADVFAKDGGRTESTAQLLIDQVGFGASDLHLQEAMELAESVKKRGSGAVLLSFRFNQGVIVNPRIAVSPEFSPKNRAVYFDEMKRSDLYRIELLTAGRHCLDEAAFEPEQILFWDGVDASGKMTGGQERMTSFDVSRQLAQPQPSVRAVIFDAAGKKVAEVQNK